MPTFGVSDTYGGSNPGGYLQSSEQTEEAEIATIRGANGKIAVAQAKPRKKTTVTLRSKGEATLATVSSGSDFTSLTAVSAKFSETNDDFPTSEVVLNSFGGL